MCSSDLGIGAAILGVGEGVANLASMAAQVTYGLPNSREFEREADHIGVELAARAGYNPRAAVTLWQKMSASNKNAPPQWMSTHPSGESRIKEIEANLPKVLPLYQRVQ